MKTIRCLFFCLLPSLPIAADVSQLVWMSGCWQAVGSETGSGEQWTIPAGGTLFGTSRSIIDGKTSAFEYLRIVTEDDGTVVLIASPSGQASTRFTLASMNDREAVFTNPEHDFPQRIIYRVDDDDNLIGQIEGVINGQERKLEFPMQKTPCRKSESHR